MLLLGESERSGRSDGWECLNRLLILNRRRQLEQVLGVYVRQTKMEVFR